MSRLNRVYEAILIVHPEPTEEVLSKLQTQFTDLAGRHSGRVLDSVNLGKRKLSYKIGKFTEATYLQVRFEVPPAEVAGLRKAVSMMDLVERVMIVEGTTVVPAVSVAESAAPSVSA